MYASERPCEGDPTRKFPHKKIQAPGQADCRHSHLLPIKHSCGVPDLHIRSTRPHSFSAEGCKH